MWKLLSSPATSVVSGAYFRMPKPSPACFTLSSSYVYMDMILKRQEVCEIFLLPAPQYTISCFSDCFVCVCPGVQDYCLPDNEAFSFRPTALSKALPLLHGAEPVDSDLRVFVYFVEYRRMSLGPGQFYGKSLFIVREM